MHNMSLQVTGIALIVIGVGGYLAYDAYRQSSWSGTPNAPAGATHPMFTLYDHTLHPYAPQPEIKNLTNWEVSNGKDDKDTVYTETDGKRHAYKDVPTFSFVPVSVFRRNTHMFDIDIPYTGPVP